MSEEHSLGRAASEIFRWGGKEFLVPSPKDTTRHIVRLNNDELYPDGAHTGSHGNVAQAIARSGRMYVASSTRLSHGDGFHDHVVVSATSRIEGEGIYNLQGERVGDAKYIGGGLLQFRLGGNEEWYSCEYPHGCSFLKKNCE